MMTWEHALILIRVIKEAVGDPRFTPLHNKAIEKLAEMDVDTLTFAGETEEE